METPITKSPASTSIESVKLDSERKELYVLRYKKRIHTGIDTKFFPFKGDLDSARARAQKFCVRTDAIFIEVQPFIFDIDVEEERFLKANGTS